eukprot:3860393-Pyramimonas_sp.AAC.1
MSIRADENDCASHVRGERIYLPGLDAHGVDGGVEDDVAHHDVAHLAKAAPLPEAADGAAVPVAEVAVVDQHAPAPPKVQPIAACKPAEYDLGAGCSSECYNMTFVVSSKWRLEVVVAGVHRAAAHHHVRAVEQVHAVRVLRVERRLEGEPITLQGR